jgi:4-diphosphocytidyl-2-C-methyl-D-erythritol kinase
MNVSAHAKINLTLRVLGKRPDGYHELESIVQLLELADTLQIDDADTLIFTCSDPALENEQNLVVRAARLLARYNAIPRGAHIHLEKAIPAQAGLGGGSSDAAVALIALNELWELRRPFDDLRQLAAELGSDVPLFLDGPTQIMRGRGESTTPVVHATPVFVVLGKIAQGLSTADVYARLQAPTLAPTHAHRQLPETDAMVRALQQGDIARIAAAVVNDLEGPALEMITELYRVRQLMLEAGCVSVLLCGSGSAVFGICPDEPTAHAAEAALALACPWTWSGRFLRWK